MPQDDLFKQALETFGPALDRLARSYEADSDKRGDLLQEIHFAVWKSLGVFAGECSLRTWVYRVAHNVAASHVIRHRRARARELVTLDEVEGVRALPNVDSSIDRQRMLDRLYLLIQQLAPLDREVIVLYLEGTDGASIGEITGLSPGNVATKIHRIKRLLTTELSAGGNDGRSEPHR